MCAANFLAGIHGMTSLEKRLFHLFDPADIRAARQMTGVRVMCPRVGHVHATVESGTAEPHDVVLELSAGRRGGMTLEVQCDSQRGRAGQPCDVLAAVFLEVDRRGLFSGVQENTPIAMSILAAEAPDEADIEEDAPEISADVPAELPASPGAAAGAGVQALPGKRPVSTRQPAWALDLEERRRLVEPAVRTRALAIADARRSAGSLVFLSLIHI